jgi:hypothetical protein
MICNKASYIAILLIGFCFVNGCFNPYDVKITFDVAPLKECLKKNEKCIIVLSVSTKNIPSSSYRDYTYSLEKLGYDFHIIGGELGWSGWITRASAMRAAILHLKNNFSEEELKKIMVVSSDTGDVLVQNNPQDLLNAYEKKCAELKTQFSKQLETEDLIIAGGEWNCGGNCLQKSSKWFERLKIDRKERYFPYPQGGFLMGSPNALFPYYEYIIKYMDEVFNDDQIALGRFVVEYPSKIYIDYKQEFAATIILGGRFDDATQVHLDYQLSEHGLALGDELSKKIGKSDKIYPAFLHIPNNTREEHVINFWQKLISHLKMTAWKSQ